MTLSKTTETSVTTAPDGRLYVRTDMIIMEDGNEISRSTQRHSVEVGADVSNEDQLVQDIAATTHTPERIEARMLIVEAKLIASQIPK